MMSKYYLGLDMGTATVGWAVTDENYELLRKKGKDMWGVRLFQEAETAVARRTLRVSRRRLQRKIARIGYLKEIFAEEIGKVDAGFYQRLEDSKYYAEDKNENQPYALFTNNGYTDREYHKEYPTIFHLRKELIESKEPHDVRLVFLSLLNMYKHRGHFLNTNLGDSGIGSFKELYFIWQTTATELMEVNIPNIEDSKWLEEILASKKYSNSGKLYEIIKKFELVKSVEKQQIEMWKLICGLTATVATIFQNEQLEEDQKKFSISFRDGNYEEKATQVETMLSEESFELFLLLKQLHDWGVLANIMKGEDKTYEYLSFARVDSYDKHGKDLDILQGLYKTYAKKAQYDEMFRIMKDYNYSAYVGSVNSGKEIIRRGGKCNAEEFFKGLKKQVESFPEVPGRNYVLKEIEKGTFLPKQLTAANGVIPNQIHKNEMKKILENAENYLPFLGEKDETGLTYSEKLVRVFEFQIPYYIGPLANGGKNEDSKNHWSVRKEPGQIFPWNFEDKINVKESAEKFIEKMVNHCTYISGEMVLPKNSLLYEKFTLLNELNNLRINGDKISPELKQRIYSDLFQGGRKITGKKLEQYLKINGHIDARQEVVISGIDQDFVNRRANYSKFQSVFETEILTYEQENIAEKIIFWSTIYGDTKKFLREKIQEKYGQVLSETQIKKIIGFKFRDWGRLSRELLELEAADKETGEISSVIGRMWNENYNLMEIIASDKFTYREEIVKKQKTIEKTLSEVEYEDLEELYCSSPVRRMVWQTLLILKEIQEVMEGEPSKIFVEMARDPNAEKKRTVSRKRKFAELYKNCKEDGINWAEEIANKEEAAFRSKKLYLYYTQKGRCMYTGERIELYDLMNDNKYDLDHIYPRHFVKDDSIENNLVLVKKEKNAHKSDVFPIESQIRREQYGLWKSLREGGFITEEKYKRLNRNDEFSDDERVGFISRQLVETRQGTKLITDLFVRTFPESEVVYVKAGNVSAFRQQYKFVKCRNVNDFHHAQDAYLNIVVGNVYHVKFTKDAKRFIKEYRKEPEKNAYHMYKMFDYDVTRAGQTAWRAKSGESIRMVKSIMRKNTPLVTRMNFEVHGQFSDQNIIGTEKIIKANGKGYLPIKTTDGRLLDVTKYGGFNKMTGAYFFLVEHKQKKELVRTIEAFPLYLKEKLNTTDKLESYCREVLELNEPCIKLEKIKMYSLLKVNGFYLYLTGRTGERLLVCNAVQLVLPEKQLNYIKKITKEGIYSEDDYKRQEVSKQQNQELYNELEQKHSKLIYARRPNPVGGKLTKGKSIFEKLPLDRQIYVLLQILQLSQLINQGADLRDIDESKGTGVTKIAKEILSNQEIKLINQSVTGLFENEIDLLTI